MVLWNLWLVFLDPLATLDLDLGPKHPEGQRVNLSVHKRPHLQASNHLDPQQVYRFTERTARAVWLSPAASVAKP